MEKAKRELQSGVKTHWQEMLIQVLVGERPSRVVFELGLKGGVIFQVMEMRKTLHVGGAL